MKANELMIGDWVKFTSKYGYGTGQVVGIEPREGSAEPTTFTIWKKDKEGNTKFFVGVSKNCVEPIHLAPDMLLTNGFELQELGGGRVDIWTGFGEDNCHDIEVEFDGDKPIHLKIDGPVYLVTPNIKYLHQLQHFLRDCETGKEITL